MEKLVNHPVHITQRTSAKLSPSSFIPFCEFGSDASIMGKRIDQFDFPVCDSFEEIIFEGQLCYQVSIEKIKTRKRLNQEDLKIGLTLLLDYNFDKTLRGSKTEKFKTTKNTTRGIVYFTETEEALVHIGTISKSLAHLQEDHKIVKPKSEVPKSKVQKSRPKGLWLTQKSHGPPTPPHPTKIHLD